MEELIENFEDLKIGKMYRGRFLTFIKFPSGKVTMTSNRNPLHAGWLDPEYYDPTGPYEEVFL